MLPAEEVTAPLFDFDISLTIPGEPLIKKNCMMIINLKGKRGETAAGRKGRPIIIPSTEYRKWSKFADRCVRSQVAMYDGPYPLTCKLWLTATFYKTPRGGNRADLSNLYQGVEDVLQSSGLIANDNLICSHDGSRKYYIKGERPRIEVRLRMKFWENGSLQKSGLRKTNITERGSVEPESPKRLQESTSSN